MLALISLSVVASSAQVLSLNISSASVTVIDPATNTVLHTITGIPWPRGSSFSPDGKIAYICSESEHSLDVVDMSTYAIMNKIKLTGHPSGSLVITTDGKYVLVPMNPFYGLALEHHDSPTSGGVDVVDTKAGKVIKTIQMLDAVHDLFRTPDGKFATAGSATKPWMTVIDLKTFNKVRRINLDNTPLTSVIERAPNGSSGRIFTEIKDFNGFESVDFKTGKTLAKITFPDKIEYGFAALKNTLGGEKATIEFNPTHGTYITPNGKELWIASRGTNYAYVYSLPDLKFMNHIFLPSKEVPGKTKLETGDPHWVVITPDGKTVYICLAHFKQVVAIDAKTKKLIATIPVGNGAKMLDVH
jgi:YVTN family beta-propeller protein